MLRTKRLPRILSLFLLFTAPDFLASGSEVQTGEAAVMYALSKSQFVLHEPIIIEFSVRNNSAAGISLTLGKDDKEHFLITIIRPNGTMSGLPPLLRGGIGTTGLHLIAPGEEYRQRLVLNEWFDFTELGSYGVEVRLKEPLRASDGSIAAGLDPFKERLRILPRDPVLLKEVCEALVRKTLASTSYEDAAEAANELSYVRDPIAVPYLGALLHSGRTVERQAVDGLRRIANPEAVEVLTGALGRGPYETWSSRETMAAGTLGMIWLEASDSTLKQTIEEALRRSGLRLPDIQR